jgi:hypothetical protein
MMLYSDFIKNSEEKRYTKISDGTDNDWIKELYYYSIIFIPNTTTNTYVEVY